MWEQGNMKKTRKNLTSYTITYPIYRSRGKFFSRQKVKIKIQITNLLIALA